MSVHRDVSDEIKCGIARSLEANMQRDAICRKYGVSEAAFHEVKAFYGPYRTWGLLADPQTGEGEVEWLRRTVIDLAMDKAILQAQLRLRRPDCAAAARRAAGSAGGGGETVSRRDAGILAFLRRFVG